MKVLSFFIRTWREMFTIDDRNNISEFLKVYNLKKLCELGVYEGDFFMKFLESSPIECVAIDKWEDYPPETTWTKLAGINVYKNFRNRVSGYKCVNIIRKDTISPSLLFPDGHFDFVYVDADHTYQGCLQDMTHWFPKVRVGGFLAGHDYSHPDQPKEKWNHCRQVSYAVHHFLKINKSYIDGFFTTKDYPESWFLRKK